MENAQLQFRAWPGQRYAEFGIALIGLFRVTVLAEAVVASTSSHE
jgi:hypothetical protein